jgi:PilZ domain
MGRKLAGQQVSGSLSHMPDRRLRTERRLRPLIAEPLSRKRDRRVAHPERRDSPRREIALDVREPGKKARSCAGDLSVEGASFVTQAPPAGDMVELMFTVPTYAGPIIAQACIVGRKGAMLGTQVSVAFTDIEIEAQLAIAQWFDQPRPTTSQP